MKLSRLEMVSRHAKERMLLQHQISVVEKPADEGSVLEPKFRVIIDGQLQDETIIALLRPVLVTELRARIAVIDAELAAMDVLVD